jgi:hypothetical protein
MQMVCKAAAKMGPIPRLGAVGYGNASDITKMGQKTRGSLTESFEDPRYLNGPFVSRSILVLDVEQV